MRIVTGIEMASVEAITINKIGLPGAVLMENAGREIARKLIQLYGKQKCFLIVIGGGNNGGDGFVVARMLQEQGVSVITTIIPNESRYEGDAGLHKRIYEQSGYRWKYWSELEKKWAETLCDIDIIVDAMLGTGTKGEVTQPYDSIIKMINTAKKETVSIDLPSGVPADEAAMGDIAIKADRTFTLQMMKLSYYLEEKTPFFGKVEVLPIGIPPATFRHLETQRCIWGKKEAIHSWNKQDSFTHKGQNGRVGIIAGSRNMPGAAALASEAAIRSGAGLTTIGTVEENIGSIASHSKEAMFVALSQKDGFLNPTDKELVSFYEGKQVIAVGPGIGRSTETSKMIAHLIKYFEGILILDADALFFVPEYMELIHDRDSPLVLTPHPGEMGHLIGETAEYVKKKRFEVAEGYAQDHRLHLVLKGPNTIVAKPNGFITVNKSGNAGLAKGGSGDVLTGIITALAARQPLQIALSTAVFMHGYSADLLLKDNASIDGMVPSDIIDGLSKAYKLFEA
ncbi:NAD(P)H-hydrate dehydratase [Shouchella patagoniensis]|uniref:NAD(P)H-hydrate dehydratase n=1 Tax=Shouchella patagoniensis TaxID=228576 RepID=UPI0014759ACC|nr:NAD(P)H-hydrate dehydratase [Shouchella patagoniensis]